MNFSPNVLKTRLCWRCCTVEDLGKTKCKAGIQFQIQSSSAEQTNWWINPWWQYAYSSIDQGSETYANIVNIRNEEPHVKKRMGKHGEKVDLILRVDLVIY